MTGTADVVVIGGGVMGLWIAWHLRAQGAGRVVLLEKRFVGAGSSDNSGAILRQHYSHPATVAMARQSLDWYRSVRERTGREIGFRAVGMVLICRAQDRPALDGNVALQQRLGVRTDIVDAAGLRALEPEAVFEEDALAAWEPEAGFVDPGRTLQALAALAREQGAEVRQGTAVSGFLRAGDRVTGVETSGDGRIEAAVVINAGGPWAGGLCRRLGLQVPLSVIRPQQAYFVPPHRGERHVCGDLLTGLYWRPEPAGWTRVGRVAYEGDETVTD
ncbi:MAG: NAD(P)/FAD-dependent oxidoreductase, partial [Planctomycetota bacterium]